jgi:hypothetical protein
MSYIRCDDGSLISLEDAVMSSPDLILGAEYASTHAGLGRLAKIFDFAERIPYHIHPPISEAARVDKNSKDEAYYLPPGVDMGRHPESFFGVHPWIAREKRADLILKHLQEWRDDLILQRAFAYTQVVEEGFFIESGILHSPGTALTIELQEDSDTMATFQAMNAGRLASKELLYKDVSETDRAILQEEALIRWIDWEANGDPDFHAKRHIVPIPIATGDGYDESWILYGSEKFSGKRLKLAPGSSYESVERGTYNLFVWTGCGTVGQQRVEGGNDRRDELLVVHSSAVAPHTITNTGESDLIIIKFFGPDINPDAPSAGTR